MSEKFSSKQDKQDAVSNAADFINVDSLGRAHVPSGSGNRSGNFMSDHELAMVEAHKDLIYDGLENRENETLLNSVGILDDPKDVRDNLAMDGFIDDDEESEWSDEDLKSYVDDARKDVDNFYEAAASRGRMAKLESRLGAQTPETTPEAIKGKRKAEVEVDAPSKAEGYVRKQDRAPGAHRAEHQDESNPLYDELIAGFNRPALSQTAEEGESFEEYEARQTTGRHIAPIPTANLESIAAGEPIVHTLEPLPTTRLDEIATGDNVESAAIEPLSTSALDAIATGEQSMPRSRGRRIRDVLTLSGAAAELSSYAERRRRRERSEREPNRGRVVLAMGGVAAAAAVVGGVLLLRHTGHDSATGSGHNPLKELFDDPSTYGGGDNGNGTQTAVDTAPKGGLTWSDFDPSARIITRGEGWNSTLNQMGIPRSDWNDVLESAGPKLQKLGEAYYDNNAGEYRVSRSGELSNDALRAIASSARRNGVSI